MKGLRGPVLLIAGIAAIPLVAVLAWPDSDSGTDRSGGGSPPADARYFNLPEGRAQIAVGTHDDRDIVVQWRDRDGKDWTDPEVAYAGGELLITLMRIRVGGPTLALFATLTPRDTYYDDESSTAELTKDDVTVFVVCRDGTCASSRKYPGTVAKPPQVTPDGAHVLLDARPDVFVTWHGASIEEQPPFGLPLGTYGGNQPVLAPDGSLRAVHGEATPDGCDFTMLLTAPGRTGFADEARYRDPDDRREVCSTNLETFSTDYLVVSRGKYDAWFLVRTGDDWRRVTEDPSGQVRYPRPGEPELAGAYERSGFWHWREVIGSSPDGRTLVVQVHFPSAETWSPPQEVARAPKGSECTSIVPMPTYTWGEEDPFYISLRCRSRSPAGEWTYSYPTAVSGDGTTWDGFVAEADGVRVGRDMFFRGRPNYRWTPEDGLHRVRLPMPPGAVMTALSDGMFAQSRLVESERGCMVEVRLARPDDTAWSDPVPSTAGPVPANLCELDMVQGDGRNVFHYFDRGSREPWTARLVWPEGEPILEDGPFN